MEAILHLLDFSLQKKDTRGRLKKKPIPAAYLNLQCSPQIFPRMISFAHFLCPVPPEQANDKDQQDDHDQAADSNRNPHPPDEPQHHMRTMSRLASNNWLETQ